MTPKLNSNSDTGRPERRLTAKINKIPRSAVLCMAAVLLASAVLLGGSHTASGGSANNAIAVPTIIITPLPARTEPAMTIMPATPLPSLPATQPAMLAEPAAQMTASPDYGSIGDPYAPELGNSGYDVQHYAIRVAASLESSYLTADVTIDAVATLDALPEISLDFVGFKISSLKLNDEAVRYRRMYSKLVIYPVQPLAAGEAFTLRIAYQGLPVSNGSNYAVGDLTGVQFVPDKNLYVTTEPDGSRYWFPCNDHPRDKATLQVELTVPQGLTGVSNGVLIETSRGVPAPTLPEGTGDRFVWQHDFPTATYLVTFAIGDYQLIEMTTASGVPVRSYIFPDQVKKYQALEGKLDEMTVWMADLLTPYPFESLGFVTVLDMGYCMETQTMIMVDVDRLTEHCMVHELAHMWFGDAVSLNSWAELWRKEGIATYLDTLWEYRDKPAGFTSEMVKLTINRDRSGFALNNLPKDSMYGWDAYQKGSLLIHNLEQKVGEDAFYAGLRQYLNQFNGSDASDGQFIEVMENASGMQLDDFFADWFREGK